MALDLNSARSAGYSDTDILEGSAAKVPGFDLPAARAAGYSDTDILEGLAPRIGVVARAPVSREDLTFGAGSPAEAFSQAAEPEPKAVKTPAADALNMPGSVLNGFTPVETKPLIEARGAPVSAETYNQIRNQFDNASVAQRRRMMMRDDAFGSVAKTIQAEYDQQDATTAGRPAPRQYSFLSGFRPDGTTKGNGFLGEIKLPNGHFATEISINVNLDGRDTEIPTLVPGLSNDELNHLLNGGAPTPAIVQKAVDHAKQRMENGKSPFKSDEENAIPGHPGMPSMQNASMRIEDRRRAAQATMAQQVEDNRPTWTQENVSKAASRLGNDVADLGMGAATGAGMGFAELGKYTTLLASVPSVARDKLMGDNDASDAMFRNVVQPFDDAIQFYKDKTPNSIPGQVGAGLGNLASTLPSIIATGGGVNPATKYMWDIAKFAAASGMTREMTLALAKGAYDTLGNAIVTMSPAAIPQAFERFKTLVEQGTDPASAGKAAFVDYATTSAMGAIPLWKSGSVATRIATGAPAGAALAAGSVEAQNLALSDYPEQQQDPLSAANLVPGAVSGGVLAGALGGHGEPPVTFSQLDGSPIGTVNPPRVALPPEGRTGGTPPGPGGGKPSAPSDTELARASLARHLNGEPPIEQPTAVAVPPVQPPQTAPTQPSPGVVFNGDERTARLAAMRKTQQGIPTTAVQNPANPAQWGIDPPIASTVITVPPTVITAPAVNGDGTRTAPVSVSDGAHIGLAEQNVNTAPTEGQKAAGNYQMGHLNWNGLNITVENPVGSTRSGTDANGQPWETTMPATYGYIKGSEGADGDHVDVYLGHDANADQVYVVDQIDPATGKFDEHKALMGFSNPNEALSTYANGFSDGSGPQRIGAITPMSMDDFKTWIRTGNTRKALKYKKPKQAATTPAVAVPQPIPSTANSAEGNPTAVTAVAPQPIQEETPALNRGSATRTAAQLTKNGFPSVAVPHPTKPGMWMVVDQGEAGTQESAPPETGKDVVSVAPPVAKKRRKPASDSLIQAIINRGGINIELKSEFDKDARPQPGLFTKGGTSDLSLLAQYLHDEDGFHQIDPYAEEDTGGSRQLVDHVIRAMGGERILNSEAAVREREADQQGEYEHSIKQQAEALGIKTKFRPFAAIKQDLQKLVEADQTHADEVNSLEADYRAAFDAVQAELAQAVSDDEMDNFLSRIVERTNGSEEYYRTASGEMTSWLQRIKAAKDTPIEAPWETPSNEIQSGNTSEARQATEERPEQSAAAGGSGAGAEPSAQEGARPSLDLQAQSREDLAAREAQRAAAEADRVKAQQAAEATERKARADAEIASRQGVAADNFQLGAQVNDKSKQRQIDAKAADDQLAGQGDIFSKPAAEMTAADHLRAAADKMENKSPAETGPQQGVVGMQLEAGQIVKTASGRDTTPFPKMSFGSSGATTKTVKAVDRWLMQNAMYEAVARGDDFNMRQFEAHVAKPSQADKDSAEEYLFGEQPPVLPSILKPLANGDENAPPKDEEQAARDQADSDFDDAMGDFADILGKNARANFTPEQEKAIIPVLVRLFDAAFRKGYYAFKDAARFVLDAIEGKFGKEVGDQITMDHLQGGYISMAGRYREQGADKPGIVAAVESKSELPAKPRVQPQKEQQNVANQRGSTDLERNRQDANAADGMGAADVQAGRPGDGEGGEQRVLKSEIEGWAGSSDSVSGHETATPGERSHIEIYTGAPGVTPSSAGSRVSEGSGDGDLFGSPIESDAAGVADSVAQSGQQLDELKQQQRAADKLAQKPGLANIKETLPFLKEGQQEDVHKAETRFAVPDGYGMLFTNGTGTGKTFTGLGIVKRMANAGKHNTLIVVPNDKIADDWQTSGKMLGLEVSRLEDTKSAGRGIVITTYANFGQNDTLAKRDWDLIVHDEAHYLAMDSKGSSTKALDALKALSLHPEGVHARARMLHRSLYNRMTELSAALTPQRIAGQSAQHVAALRHDLSAVEAEVREKVKAVQDHVDANQGERRPRALFLSATPFAYEKAVDWANGYLFDYGPEPESGAYNAGSAHDRFFMQHFGYRMRYNKLTEPDSKVDRGLMQRQFNSTLKKAGSVSGRMLDVAPDYDRKFVLVDSAIGRRIDEALEWFEVERKAHSATLPERSFGDLKTKALNEVSNKIAEQFDYLSRRYLLEAIKAEEAVKIVKQHLALNRKVVIFHDYKKGGGFNPFNVNEHISDDQAPDAVAKREAYNAVVKQFRTEFKDLINSDAWRTSSPITTFMREFPNLLLFNGDIPKLQRRKNVEAFQSDDSGAIPILVQSAAGREGISLHDTTGKHQRVLINLGQPTQPATSIQQEGRIYRVGQVTDAVFRYLNTGTNWEKWAFATTIAQRASAVENLGMGEQARALKDAFISGFEESSDYPPGMEGEGKGGKARDKAANDALTEYDRARSFYFGTEKKNSRTKAQEGSDYFATPEPVGLKMVEWADMRPGEDFLEPSAGHGAIARWAPETAVRTAIEPSMTLRPRLAMVFDGKIVDTDFEDLNVVNKYDAIVMNPPFGTSGKMAMDHVIKAVSHLREGGRLVALIPTGPAMDKRFKKWFYEKSERPAAPLYVDPNHGPVFKGDTLTMTGFGQLHDIVVGHVDGTAKTARYVRASGARPTDGINITAITKVKPTGTRTETYDAAEGLHFFADIVLPDVTFERAGTKVTTRVVILDKSDNAPPLTKADFRDATDINDLFDRLEDYTVPARVKPVEAAAEPEPTRGASKPVVDTAAAKQAADALGLPIIEHTTGKGKVLRGVVRTDLSKDEAKAIDNFTFKKDGGWFISEKHLASQGEKFQTVMRSAEPVFYSALSRAVDAMPKANYPTAQWKAILGNLTGKGIKADEIQWSGINDWLDLQPGKVSKEQVQEFLQGNGVQVREVTLQDQGYKLDANGQRIDDGAGGFVENGRPTKFSSYQLPGGENYKELLLTLPAKDTITEKPVNSPPGWGDTEGGNIGVERTGNTGADYRGGHFDQPNILAHVRFNERVDSEGRKVLFLEELQSDWAQKGRKAGFQGTGIAGEPFDQGNGKWGVRWPDGIVSGGFEREGAVRVATKGKSGEGVPPAPFVGKTEAWVALALKRMIRWAVDNGSSGSQAYIKATEPEGIGKLGENVLGRELASMMPLEHMDGGVLATVHHDQVARAIGARLPVDVVNDLVAAKSSPDDFLRDSDVVMARLSIDHRRRVADALLSALRSISADLGAKLRVAQSTGRDEMLLPAMRASDLSAREVVGLLSPQLAYHDGASGRAIESSATRAGTKQAAPSIGSSIGGREFSPAELAKALTWHAEIIARKTGDIAPVYEAPSQFDRVAWTTGEQQAARYDLSKQISKVRFRRTSGGIGKAPTEMGQGVLEAYDLNGQKVIDKHIADPAEIEDYVGKEVARKLIEQPGTAQNYAGLGSHVREVSGLDLKVGGEGMKGFYDKIVAGVARDVLKKLGGGKVGEVHLETDSRLTSGMTYEGPQLSRAALHGFNIESLDNATLEKQFRDVREQVDSGQPFAEAMQWNGSPALAKKLGGKMTQNPIRAKPQPGFDITPELREKVMGGLPLFSNGSPYFSDRYKANTDEIVKRIVEIAKRIAPQTDLQVVDQLFRTDPKTGKRSEVAGIQNAAQNLISVALRYEKPEENLRHETIHALKAMGLFTKAEWRLLESKAAGWREQHGIASRYEFMEKEIKDEAKREEAYNEEGIADGFAKFKAGEDVGGGLIPRIFAKIREFLHRLANMLRGMGFDTVESVFGKIERGVVGRRGMKEEPSGGEKFGEGSRTVEVDGVRRPIENSNGKPIGETMHEQLAFWRWFQDSKAVDDQGRPLVVYHGTRANFDSFREGTGWFTTDPNEANLYGGLNGSGANIMPTYLSIKNPRILEAKTASKDKIFDALSLLDKDQDGVLVMEDGRLRWAIVSDPTQVKSALGNRGSFDPGNPDIRYNEPGNFAAPTPENIRSQDSVIKRAGESVAKYLESPKEMVSSLRMMVVPMAEGTDEARSIAKDFANQLRLAQWQANQFDDILRKKFTDKERARMWDAGDEENTLRMRGITDKTQGLESLNPKQREIMQTMSDYGNALLQKARDAGMFKGEGVEYWTPRMAVQIGEDGEFHRVGGIGGGGNDAKNVRTTAGSLKERKYDTAAETEAAMAAKGMTLVRDIRTMPIAMARLERAIAGRTLVNQIKAVGQMVGEDMVNEDGGPNFFTIDHPAFKTYAPKMELAVVPYDELSARGNFIHEGKVFKGLVGAPEQSRHLTGHVVNPDGTVSRWQPALDAHGNQIMEGRPLHINKEFQGPLKAVLTGEQNTLYRALMSLKSRTMGLIMYSPIIHNAVEWGRALPAMDWKGKMSLGLHTYITGYAAKNDTALMRDAIEHGLVPISGRGAIQDITDLQATPDLKAGRSWTAKLLAAPVSLISEQGGTAVKKAIDAAGDFWHQTLLWNRVGDLQAGLYVSTRASLINKGVSENDASWIAAHFANRFAGTLPRESMSEGARQILNLALFSRTFTLGNLGVMKDMITGLPKDVQAQILSNSGEIARKVANNQARRIAIAAFIIDIALMYIANSLLQDWLKHLKGDEPWGDLLDAYGHRYARLVKKLKADPASVLAHPFDSIESLSSTSTNEPGKEGRVHVGNEDNGTWVYVRVPTGKIGEEFTRYASPFDDKNGTMSMLKAKESTFLRPLHQIVDNDSGFGKKIYSKEYGMRQNAVNLVLTLLKAQIPSDQLISAWDLARGKGDDMDARKIVGPMVGLTYSKGAPGGPSAGMLFDTEDRYRDRVAGAMQEANRLLKDGDIPGARAVMKAAGMNGTDINAKVKHFNHPGTYINENSMDKFNREATPEDKARMREIRTDQKTERMK